MRERDCECVNVWFCFPKSKQNRKGGSELGTNENMDAQYGPKYEREREREREREKGWRRQESKRCAEIGLQTHSGHSAPYNLWESERDAIAGKWGTIIES